MTSPPPLAALMADPGELSVSCLACHHNTTMPVATLLPRYTAKTLFPEVWGRFRCSACGSKPRPVRDPSPGRMTGIASADGSAWTRRPGATRPSLAWASQIACVGTGRLRVRLTERALGLKQRASATPSSLSERAPESALDCAPLHVGLYM
jgi:hypothetical protein